MSISWAFHVPMETGFRLQGEGGSWTHRGGGLWWRHQGQGRCLLQHMDSCRHRQWGPVVAAEVTCDGDIPINEEFSSFINAPRHPQSICQFINLLRLESPYLTCGPASVFQAQSYFPRSVCQAVQAQRRTAKSSGPGEVSHSLFSFTSLSTGGIVFHVPLNS